jgi:single-stranded-DNA-specific exonuclease
MTVASLPLSIAQVLAGRGLAAPEQAAAFLEPELSQLSSPHAFSQMETAVNRLLAAVKAEQPIAIYADRDVDGLTGLAILVRTIRTIGGSVVWGSPMKGRGLEREVLERLVESAKVMVLVDCGTGEHAELEWLQSKNIDVIVADHHRFTETRPPALAWIHPGTLEKNHGSTPAGCVMAFKLAQAIWLSFLGPNDPERMDYFLFSHLDLVCMGILADRMPLLGDNRILVWHGLRRLAYSRKTGLASLMRFFRLLPRSTPLSVREVSWQIIPILNAGGRLGRPDLTAELLITEDADVARDCIDQLLALNTRRRAAQDESLSFFEKAVLEQCSIESDKVLVALAQGLEPSVTGLAAQALARKYGRPAFLFVDQGEHSVGSGRGLSGVDLFAWVETHQECVVKFGGHQGAVGLTLRTADFATFRSRLLTTADGHAKSQGQRATDDAADISDTVQAKVALEALDEFWWLSLKQLAPFGTGNPMPLFEVNSIESIQPVKRHRSKDPVIAWVIKSGTCEINAHCEDGACERVLADLENLKQDPTGPWTVIGYPVAVKKTDREFTWMIRDLYRSEQNGKE